MAGKKVISKTTATFDGQSKPNHITAIGATPTSGIVPVSAATGSRPRCRKGERSIAMPQAMPRPEPSRKPVRTDLSTVCTKSPPSVAARSHRAVAMSAGAGSSTRGTAKAVTSSCQK